MSQIDSLDFGRFIKQQNTILTNTLKEKGINAFDGQSLARGIGLVNSLSASNNVYAEEPIFKSLREYYEIDPLLTRNGGTYENCYYVVVTDKYDTFRYYNTSNDMLLITSGGHEISATGSVSASYTWQNDDMKTLSTGENVRWARMYKKYAESYVPITCPSGQEADEDCLFILGDSHTFGLNYVGGISCADIRTNIREYVLGYNVQSASVLTFRKLQFLYCYTNTIIVGQGAIRGIDERLNYRLPNNIYVNLEGNGLFSTENTILSQGFMSDFISRIKTTNFSNRYLIWCSYIGSFNTLDFSTSEIKTFSNVIIPGNSYVVPLRKINISTLTSIPASFFRYLSYLETVYFYQNFNVSGLYLNSSNKISIETMLNLFNNLADRTGTTTGLIYLGTTNLNKLTDAEKLIATNKNWTLI